VAKNARLRTGYLIKRVEMLVRTKLEIALRDLGLTTGQYAALSLLASMPETSSARLSRAIGVTPQTMAETIVAFERDDLIQREVSSEHKRILQITLSPKGKALLKKCEARATDVENELFSMMSKHDVDQFRSLLQMILRRDGDARS
jgi:DNA-binding MarR family transcriptional regulator